MFPITTAQLLSLPEGAAPGASQRLPWANGSLLAAKLGSADAAGSAQLLLGGFRLRAQVPPTIPMGNVWLLLVNHEMPARFRILSEAETISLLIQMLHKSSASRTEKPAAKPSPEKQVARAPVENGWSRLETDFLPFAADITADGYRLLVRDQKDGNPHIILHHSVSSDCFYMQGRVDLEYLGAVLFTLEGSDKGDWRLLMYTSNTQGFSHLRADFHAWLASKQKTYTGLDGGLVSGLPDNLSSLPDDIQA